VALGWQSAAGAHEPGKPNIRSTFGRVHGFSWTPLASPQRASIEPAADLTLDACVNALLSSAQLRRCRGDDIGLVNPS
jgi:hypothetical protein